MSLANILVGPLAALASEFITDKDKANELAFRAATLAGDQAFEIQKGQLEVNKQEAAHKSLFVAGWRPFIGWTCGLAMAFNFLAVPMLSVHYPIMALDITTMFPVLMALLGMGAFRTAEKFKGVAREK